jgi:hypothetical protein
MHLSELVPGRIVVYGIVRQQDTAVEQYYSTTIATIQYLQNNNKKIL